MNGMGLGQLGGLGRLGRPARYEGVGVWFNERPLMFGALGDSIVSMNATTSAAWAADVGTIYQFTGRGWFPWAGQTSSRKWWSNVYACEGYSGQRTDQILAGMKTASFTIDIGVSGNTATHPWGVRAVRPDYAFVMAGTNDITQSIATATIVTNLRAIWAALRAAGVEPIALSILPRNSPAIRADQVPIVNAAIVAAAATDGVHYIDINTTCNNGSDAFKAGYTYISNADDATGLHPGNEGCHAIAAAIVADLASWLPNRVKVPFVKSATLITVEHGDGRTQDVSIHSTMGGGLFPATTGWSARFEQNVVSSIAVSAASPAEIGNRLRVTLPAPSGAGTSDRRGPSTYAVTPGRRYAMLARFAFAAGHVNDDLEFGLGNTNGYGVLHSIKAGGQSGMASSVDGASFAARDFYQEIVIPPGITVVRPWINQTINTASPGHTFDVAQLGLRELAY